MKKNNIFFLLFFIFIACKAQDYKVIHTSNNIINSIYYFHSNNEEFARVYGDTSPKDSLTFIKKGNDLIMEEFTIIEKEKKSNGNIRYVDYFSSVSDIISTGNPLFINEVPIINFNFIKKDLDLELLAKQNCHFTSNSYNHCDFILPKEDELSYLPINSRIISINLTRKNNYLKKLDIKAEYMGQNIFYQRVYYYNGKKLKKIITSIQDSNSTNTYVDKFEIIKI